MRPGWRGLLPLLALWVPAAAAPQQAPDLRVRAQDTEWSVPVDVVNGFAAVTPATLRRVGWTVEQNGSAATLTGPQGARVQIRVGTPFFRWGDDVLQFTDAPYLDGRELRIPAQLLTDFFPRRLPDLFTFDGRSMRLGYAGRAGPRGPAPDTPGADLPRVVIIDAGHGGKDPGSISKAGLREKSVALGVALALAHDLDTIPGLEVHLLRKSDTFIPLWDRGPLATKLKGDRPGVFISIHANSGETGARGFETYFLSDARTDHERRVAAIENAPMGREEEGVKPGGELDLILRDMKNLDTQHWSALLAQMVQDQMGDVHPGPNRGVKQAPLAVLTNALMPGVLVEVGFMSQPEEARLLRRPTFQQEAGEAIAKAVTEFFQRYPPGTSGLSGSGG